MADGLVYALAERAPWKRGGKRRRPRLLQGAPFRARPESNILQPTSAHLPSSFIVPSCRLGRGGASALAPCRLSRVLSAGLCPVRDSRDGSPQLTFSRDSEISHGTWVTSAPRLSLSRASRNSTRATPTGVTTGCHASPRTPEPTTTRDASTSLRGPMRTRCRVDLSYSSPLCER
jgi:hypothetical protein